MNHLRVKKIEGSGLSPQVYAGRLSGLLKPGRHSTEGDRCPTRRRPALWEISIADKSANRF